MSTLVRDRCLPAVDDVLVFDDLLDKELLRRIHALVQMPIWAYGWKSCAKKDRFSFWHAHFAGGDESSSEDCTPEIGSRASTAPVLEVWQALQSGILSGHTPVRAYANAHTYGVDGSMHTDSKESDYFSTILYAHPRWMFNWAGETVFVSKQTGDIVRSVHPKPGRVVLFRGATPHVARSPSRDCPELRISIVFKTRAGAHGDCLNASESRASVGCELA